MADVRREDAFSASNRHSEWRELCAEILGISIEDEIRQFRPPLAAHDLAETDRNDSVDEWTASAMEINENILMMMNWIAEKRDYFISLEVPANEASLIQSTVASFTAATTNECEALRTMLPNDPKSQVHVHRSNIVQILLERLQIDIAEPFAKLQKLHGRLAARIWQKPFENRLAGSLRPFVPTRPSHRLHADFLQTYENNVLPALERPQSRLFVRKRVSEDNSTGNLPPKKQKKPAVKNEEIRQTDDFSTPAEVLQLESIQIAAQNSDLDDFQQIENAMVDITSLLSRFTDLVAEQQENVLDIRDAAATAKENMDAGQEQLAEAKERTRRSNHYMAKTIAGLGVMLLLLNWLRP